jgi:antitoxin component of MazEF toxin-antitoxin module
MLRLRETAWTYRNQYIRKMLVCQGGNWQGVILYGHIPTTRLDTIPCAKLQGGNGDLWEELAKVVARVYIEYTTYTRGVQAMMMQKIRKVGNSYVVTISKEEMERLDLHENDLVGIEVRKLHVTPQLSPELDAALQRSLDRYKAGYEYLAEH